MTRTDQSAAIRRTLAAGMGLGLITVAGCTAPRTEVQPSAYSATMSRPVLDRNAYPVIEGQRPAAAAQMSNDEAASQEARLTALSSKRASGAISQAEYLRRRKQLQDLAENHGADTLKEIQN